VPTQFAPACGPLEEFSDVLENRTSRALGETKSCTGAKFASLGAASSYVIILVELLEIHYNGEAIDSRTGYMNSRDRWTDL
jgi:hypothetical protein